MSLEDILGPPDAILDLDFELGGTLPAQLTDQETNNRLYAYAVKHNMTELSLEELSANHDPLDVINGTFGPFGFYLLNHSGGVIAHSKPTIASFDMALAVGQFFLKTSMAFHGQRIASVKFLIATGELLPAELIAEWTMGSPLEA